MFGENVYGSEHFLILFLKELVQGVEVRPDYVPVVVLSLDAQRIGVGKDAIC